MSACPRREALAAVLAAATLWPLGCATAAESLRTEALAEGVWVVPGSGGEATAGNLGRIGNLGFVAGDRGVVAVDMGTSMAHGRAMLAAIAARAGERPVLRALVTHTRPEFLFGGSAFKAAGVPIHMHEKTARLMAARCEGCLKTLRQVLGEASMRGTEMYEPDGTFADSIDLPITGRPLRVLYFGHSSGPGDIAVFDEASGVLFAGGLADHARVPDIQDGDIDGWRRALAALRALPVRTVIPGHGAPGGPAMLDAVDGYLQALSARARELVQSSTSLLEVPDAADLPAYRGWDQYDIVHRRNASIAYLRAERAALFQ